LRKGLPTLALIRVKRERNYRKKWGENYRKNGDEKSGGEKGKKRRIPGIKGSRLP